MHVLLLVSNSGTSATPLQNKITKPCWLFVVHDDGLTDVCTYSNYRVAYYINNNIGIFITKCRQSITNETPVKLYCKAYSCIQNECCNLYFLVLNTILIIK